MPDSRPMLELFRELNDLKRVRAAHASGSIAERLFVEAWTRLAAGEEIAAVTRSITGRMLVATRLTDLPEAMESLGVDPPDVAAVMQAGLAEHAGTLPCAWLDSLRSDLSTVGPTGNVPPFVAMLARQPRAGVTCPGHPRLLFEPPESHAEHCIMVAVYGVLLAPEYEAEAETVFLAGLSHHLHNARLPDAGFTGEMLLGPHLDQVMRTATEAALRMLTPSLRARVEAARTYLPDATTPEGRAFNAADTIDRVLQIDQHLRAGRTTLRHVLDDMQLVHAGPVKAFQDTVLQGFGLA
jgi:5'-deoxynucleotidase YfbR-like HD superfamily hydrolase